jgi:hypothetical protein
VCDGAGGVLCVALVVGGVGRGVEDVRVVGAGLAGAEALAGRLNETTGLSARSARLLLEQAGIVAASATAAKAGPRTRPRRTAPP